MLTDLVRNFKDQSVMPERYAGTMVAQNLWERSTNVWFNVRSMPYTVWLARN